ncbi:MAG: uroporphyrinogen-III C-methyltransferase [Parvibaculum sp.]
MRIVSSLPSEDISMSKGGPGRVTLVGAGTGDPDLLTIKALRALQSADVILFDDLVSDEILDLARSEVRRMLVGKRGGRLSCKQDDINATMIKLAKAGHHVVRLKSGDPMIFGRGGEEMAALRAEGIAVTVVPGITSALAMAATCGVSLTHRDRAQSVRFVTAHNRQGALPDDLDWVSFARAHTTTIFYMGGRMSGELSRRLMREGASPATPVVIVSALTRRNETRVLCNLRDLAKGIIVFDLDQPILIGVGQVFADAKIGVSFMFEHAGSTMNDAQNTQMECAL